MSWEYRDATAATGAPKASSSFSPLGYANEVTGTQHFIYIGVNDFHIHELWWDGISWHHHDLTAATGGPKGAFLWTAYGFTSQGTQHVFFSALVSGEDDFRIHELWCDSNGWHHHDLTAATGAPLVRTTLTGYVFAAQATQHLIFTGMDNHVHELWWDSGGWHHHDLTTATGAPLPQITSASIAAYAFEAQATQHVMYNTDDQHVHELWQDNHGWHHTDLTAATGAPLAYSVGTGYGLGQGEQRVFYAGNDNHIHQLSWDSNGWHHHDLTAAAGAPSINVLYSVPHAYVFGAQGLQHVLYLRNDLDGHIQELWQDEAGWHHTDLTAATGAPLAGLDSTPNGYASSANSSQHALYTTADQHVIELYWAAPRT